MSAAWMELHSTLLGHPKVDRLAHKLEVNKLTATGVITNLWCWACRNAEDGNLSKYEIPEIARGIGWNRKADHLFAGLIEAGWVDDRHGQLVLHDWDKHGVRLLKQSKDRQKKYRERGEFEAHSKSSSGALNAAKNALSK